MRTSLWCSVAIAIGACAPVHQYSYVSRDGVQRALPASELRVVTAHEAERSGLEGRPMTIPFDGERADEAAAEFLERAGRVGARLVSQLALVVQTDRDGQVVECRSEIVAESTQETRRIPAQQEIVLVTEPVKKRVAGFENVCRPRLKPRVHTYTDYERTCTTRGWGKDSHYECKSEPVTRTRTEQVYETTCTTEVVSKSVTRDEVRHEVRHVPERVETTVHSQLRELDPVCGASRDGEAPRRNRLEGRIFMKPRPRSAQREPVPAR